MFALSIRKHVAKDSALFIPCEWLFLALAFSSLIGGTVHGFFPDDPSSHAFQFLWRITLLGVGAVALASWKVSAALLSRPVETWIARLASFEFAGYAVYVTVFDHTFRAAIINYLPPVI